MDCSAELSAVAFKDAPPSSPHCETGAAIAADLRRGAWAFAAIVGSAALVRLILEPGYWHLPFAGLLAATGAYAWGQGRLVSRATPGRLRAAIGVNFLAVGLGYALIGAAMNAAAGWRGDPALYRIEQTLFGGDPQRFLTALHAPWVSTVAILGYIGFVVILIYLFLCEALRLTAATGALQARLMLLYGLGYGGYLLVPAEGPGFHHGGSLGPIPQTAFSRYFYDWVVASCSRVDAWPSLHGGVCCFALIWTYRRHRRAFWLLLAPSLALVLGAVYFRFHYFIDLIAGGLLAVLCLWPSPRRASGQT